MSFISGFCHIREGRIITSLQDYRIAAGTVEEFLNEGYSRLKVAYPKFYKMDPQSQFGFLASEILLQERSIKQYPPEGISVVLSNSTASLDTDIRFQKSMQAAASPSLFVYTLANIVMGEICIRHGIKGENAFFITPAFDPQLLADYVENVLEQEHVEACVAGWVDVLGEYYDVFLYLAEKKSGMGQVHTAEEIEKLYTQ